MDSRDTTSKMKKLQCVVAGGDKSGLKSVISGVSQGSTVNPLLFVCINNIQQFSKNSSEIALYADDTKI